MKTIAFSQREEPGHARNREKGTNENVHPYQHETNLTEGSEFLDDAIRTEEQPFDEKKNNEWDDFLENSFE
jgi:hypothetical protein